MLRVCRVKRLNLGRVYQGTTREGTRKACHWEDGWRPLDCEGQGTDGGSCRIPRLEFLSLYTVQIVRLLSQFSGRQWGKITQLTSDSGSPGYSKGQGGNLDGGSDGRSEDSTSKASGARPTTSYFTTLFRLSRQSSQIHRYITRGKTLSSKLCSHS